MNFHFSEKSFLEIEKVLETKFAKRGEQYRAVLLNSEEGRKLSIEIYPDLQIGEKKEILFLFLLQARIFSSIFVPVLLPVKYWVK